MIPVLAAHGQEGRRVKPGEGPEIVDEMRLIEIPAGLRNRGPCDASVTVDLPQDILKTANAAEKFRRESDLGAECLDEPPPTQADVVGDFAHASHGRARKEPSQREANRRVARQRPPGN